MKKILKNHYFNFIATGLRLKPLKISLIISSIIIIVSIFLDYSSNPQVREYTSIAFFGMGGIIGIMGLSLFLGMRKENPIRYPIYLAASIIWFGIGLWAIYKGITSTFIN